MIGLNHEDRNREINLKHHAIKQSISTNEGSKGVGVDIIRHYNYSMIDGESQGSIMAACHANSICETNVNLSSHKE